MSDVIAVNFGSLMAGAEAATAGARQMDGKLAQLDADLQPLVANWTGDAAAAYQVHQRTWRQGAAEIHQLLNSIGGGLHTAHGNFPPGVTRNRARYL